MMAAEATMIWTLLSKTILNSSTGVQHISQHTKPEWANRLRNIQKKQHETEKHDRTVKSGLTVIGVAFTIWSYETSETWDYTISLFCGNIIPLKWVSFSFFSSQVSKQYLSIFNLNIAQQHLPEIYDTAKE